MKGLVRKDLKLLAKMDNRIFLFVNCHRSFAKCNEKACIYSQKAFYAGLNTFYCFCSESTGLHYPG